MKEPPYQIIFDDDAQTFLESVRPLLEKNEAQNNLLLGISESLAKKNVSTAMMVKVISSEKLVAAAIHTDSHALILYSEDLHAIDSLALHLAQNQKNFPGVVADKEVASHFSEIWSRIQFCESELAVEQGLYQLETVTWPKKVEGQMRVASPQDLDLISDWIFEFNKEVLPHENRQHEKIQVDNDRSFERFHLWEVKGEIKSLAAWARPTKSGIVINTVYTPRNLRGNGYATNLVAELSQKCLDMGKKFCCLYTDMNNPTSNRLYQNIGYRLVGHSRHFIFL